MTKNIFLLLGIFVGAISFGVGAISLTTQQQINALPIELKLKVDKADILGSTTINEITSYAYISSIVLPAEKKYGVDELIDKRISNARFWKVGTTKDGRDIIKVDIYGGATFYKKDTEWRQIDYATTTEKAYNLQTFSFIPKVYATDFVATANYYVSGNSTSYSVARATSNASSETTYNLGQQYAFTTKYTVWRNYFKFDTSSIGSGSSVTAVTLTLTAIDDGSLDNFDIQIVKQNWSAQDPIDATNREAAYDNNLGGTADDNIWRNTLNMSLNTPYTSGALATAWVNKIGNTYYGLRSSRDYAGITPTQNEYIGLATRTNATVSYRPTLNVTYSAAAVATPVQNQDIILFE